MLVQAALVLAAASVLAALAVGACHARMRQAVARSAARMSAQELAAAVRDGDVLAFAVRRAQPMSTLVGAACGSVFYHMGVVVRVGERPLLMHFVDPKERAFFAPRYVCMARDGLCLSDLAPLLTRYGAGTLVAVAKLRDPLPGHAFRRAGMSVACPAGAQPKRYDSGFLSTYAASVWRAAAALGASGPGGVLHCNTFVGAVLERVGAVPAARYPVLAYTPGGVLRLLESSPMYAPPLHVVLTGPAVPS